MNHHRQRPFQTLSSRIAWSCPWYSVRQDEIITPDGKRGVYNTVSKSDAVWIVPVTGKGNVVLVYQYRYTVDDWYGICDEAGHIFLATGVVLETPRHEAAELL